ncbi:hypothetical protein NPA31_011875 [Aurantimonas sp. MSK8Z-1]|uniref:hypothetical protein n=1 Tax=Mangrovibrevibacter kandeliae TaxID=2968473 RepID=UPI002117578F|nr:hypothetical protein [Aurantimonas sp. MSK8Z-1]MCW4115662.1 hypothetical protein [Aurantimonas sp. MSK8Z-1]
MSQRPDLMLALKVAMGTISALCALYCFFALGPMVEARWFPVLGKLRIVQVDALSPRTSVVMTEFDKLRDCEYLGIAWYYNEASAFERVSMVPIRDPDDTSAPNRPTGAQRAGPWRIAMSAEAVRGKSFVQAFHRCHPFWTTVTNFYP